MNDIILATKDYVDNNTGSNEEVVYMTVSASEYSAGLQYPINLETNWNGRFFKCPGKMTLTHVMIPSISVRETGVYVGYILTSKTTYKKSDFVAISTEPTTATGSVKNMVFEIVNYSGISFNDVNENWSGWLDSGRASMNGGVFEFTKSIVDGEEVYTRTDGARKPFPIHLASSSATVQYWSSVDPYADGISSNCLPFNVRGSMYPNVPVVFGARLVFTPDKNKWPQHKVMQ